MSARTLIPFIVFVAVGVWAYAHGSMPDLFSHGAILLMHGSWIIWKVAAVLISLVGLLVLRLRRARG